jgi:PAS domain-containing protein
MLLRRRKGTVGPGSVDVAEIGSFTWDIVLDRLWGNADLARIMGLPAAAVNDGMSIAEFLDFVHPEDRPHLAAKIHKSILTVSSNCGSYRLRRDDGSEPIWVTGFGHYYRVQDGLPTLCSGTIELADVA